MTRNIADIRNLVVCGHGGAGKTSLVDRLLVMSGAVSSKPSVDAGTSVCDFDEEEKHHKHSIEATVTHFDHAGKHFNVIDTPGYPDLVGQMIGSLRAVETALIAIDAHAGIKVNTRRAWNEAGKAGCGRILVLTKLDADNIDFAGLITSIQEAFGSGCVPLNVPLGISGSLRGVTSTLQLGGGRRGSGGRSGGDQRGVDRVDCGGGRGGDGALFRGRAAVRRGTRKTDGAGDGGGDVDADCLCVDEE